MIEKKAPNQKIIADDFSDDDPIIELNDEVIINPAEDRKATASPGIDNFIPENVDKNPSLGVDEGITVFEENAKSSLQNNPFTDTDGRIADDNNNIEMPADIEFECEEDEEIIPLAELDDDDVETDDDIIEITEFDQHFPDDHDETLAHAGLLDPSDLADKDFLELFDIKEEDPMEDEEMRKLSESEEKAVEDELSRFFDDALEDDSGIENNAPQSVERFSALEPDLDLARAAAALSAEAGKRNRRPDTLFAQDPTGTKETTPLLKNQSEKNEHMLKNSAESTAGDSPVFSPEQIDQAIERIINEKLAGRIEHIIYEIIEKAVKKEIDRLKESLLEDSTPDDTP